MIALDTNFLVYAHRSDNPFHNIVRAAISKAIDHGMPLGIPVVCVHEYLAVVTNPRIFHSPTPPDLAFDQIHSLTEVAKARLLLPGQRHLGVLRRLAFDSGIRGAQFHDARIAAICIENGVSQIWSADRDFSAFKELDVRTPQSLVNIH